MKKYLKYLLLSLLLTFSIVGNSQILGDKRIPSQLAASDLLTDIISYWKFDVGDRDGDELGNNDWTTNVGCTNVAGHINEGEENDVNPHKALINNSTLSFSDGNDLPFSVAFWISFDSLSAVQSIIMNREGAGEDEWGVITVSSFIQLNLFDAGNDYFRVRYDISGLATGTFYHFVFTYDGSETTAGIKIYRDGSLQTVVRAEIGTYDGMTLDLSSTTHSFRFYSAINYLNGILDEMGVWGRELGQPDVTELYNSGSGLSYPF